jgi:hypothetical protein
MMESNGLWGVQDWHGKGTITETEQEEHSRNTSPIPTETTDRQALVKNPAQEEETPQEGNEHKTKVNPA